MITCKSIFKATCCYIIHTLSSLPWKRSHARQVAGRAGSDPGPIPVYFKAAGSVPHTLLSPLSLYVHASVCRLQTDQLFLWAQHQSSGRSHSHVRRTKQWSFLGVIFLFKLFYSTIKQFVLFLNIFSLQNIQLGCACHWPPSLSSYLCMNLSLRRRSA